MTESGAELFEHDNIPFTSRPNARFREQESEARLGVSTQIPQSARLQVQVPETVVDLREQQLENLAPSRESARI